jgi:hypothetical protein
MESCEGGQRAPLFESVAIEIALGKESRVRESTGLRGSVSQEAWTAHGRSAKSPYYNRCSVLPLYKGEKHHPIESHELFVHAVGRTSSVRVKPAARTIF